MQRIKSLSAPSSFGWLLLVAIVPLGCAAEAIGQSESEEDIIELGTAEQAHSVEEAVPGFVTSVKPYVVSVSPEYAVQPILSVGDRVPRSSNPDQEFQLVGIPDGMGAYRTKSGRTVVYINHELVQSALSEPIIGEPLNRGTIVSRLVLDRAGRVLSADRAYDTVWDENTLVGAAADVSNTTPAFSRFCSGSLEYKAAGFDRPIYFAGEEAGGAATFDGKGGLGVAIFDGELHTLPKFGRFPWENTLAQPKPGKKTVLIGMEDGPATPDNQLYLYVGSKERKPGATAMRRNGLDNGKMYAFVSDTPGIATEPAFVSGTIEGHWVEIPEPELLTDVQLEAASDAIGAFGFIRTEDGAFDTQDPDTYYFVTTGSGAGNELGRLYRMKLDPEDPTGHTTIELLSDANAIVAAGGDTAVSPDNLAVDDDYIMINEDGTAQSRLVMAQKGRDGSVWRFDKRTLQATRVAELFPPGRDANFAITSGVWETTGIVSVDGFGGEAWLLNVQAHAPTAAPGVNTVEDGQFVLLRRTKLDALTSVE
jgi:secreted PhoX family phosphatase